MRKVFSIALLLIAAMQAKAAYQCNVMPDVDVTISPQSVTLSGAAGEWEISPQGEIQRDGKPLTLNATTREQAQAYQSALRRDLPWINQGARDRLESSRQVIDQVIVDNLGKESNVRQRLTKLDKQLRAQMDTVIGQRGESLVFHHQAIKQVQNESEQLVQNALGGVVQDSLNEMGKRGLQNAGGDSNPLQAILGNLGGFQQSLKEKWSGREADFKRFGDEVCQRVTAFEAQRKALQAAIK
ncbi:MAG: hypothetical protein XXXJIFNMEKO3_00644 [Candidatus Erwinia impunctatus]|nr:hypothetical protein XXXJIFNMEKO_00644 [Culicoides impunctatus]